MRVRHRRLLLSLVDVLPCWFTDLSGPGLPSFFHSLTFDGIIIIVILCIQPPLETRFSLSIAQPTADVSLVDVLPRWFTDFSSEESGLVLPSFFRSARRFLASDHHDRLTTSANAFDLCPF